MAKITARNGKLVLDFSINGSRLREQTSLDDTKANRKKMEKVLNQILEDFQKEQLDYSRYFPGSKLINKVRMLQLKQTILENQSSPTVEAFAAFWFQEQASKLRPPTFSSYQHYYEKRIRPFWKKFELKLITRKDILKYQARLLSTTNPDNKEVIKPATVNRSLQILRLLLNDAAKKLDFESPFVDIPFSKVDQNICPFSESEVTQIIDTINPEYHTYILVWFYTGMRTREINGLRWKSVNLEIGVIKVVEVYCERVGFQPIKGEDSNRVIRMSFEVHQALVQHHDQTYDSDDLTVFKMPGKTIPVNNSTFCNGAWKSVLKKTGIFYRSPVQIRNTTAVFWLNQGKSPCQVAQELGGTYRGELVRLYGKFVPSLIFLESLSIESLLQRAYQSSSPSPESTINSFNSTSSKMEGTL